MSNLIRNWGVTGFVGAAPQYIRPDSLSNQGQVGDLDGVLVLPLWPGGPKRIERLSGRVPTSWIGGSDIEPIARAAGEVLQVPFDPQSKTESSVYRLLDASLAHLQSYNNWYSSERGEKHHRAAVNDDHQYFLPFESALEMGSIGGVGTTRRPGDKSWNKLLQVENGLEDDGFISDGTKLFRLAILHNGEAAAVPPNANIGDEVFTIFMSPTKLRGSKQWVACVGRPVSGFEATNEAIARYAKQQFLKPLKNSLDPGSGSSDGKSIPGSDWASLGPFADKGPTLKGVEADIALQDDVFDIRHYRVIGVAVDASAPRSLHARASIHYAAIH
ncbi:hypothetical protein PG991_012261 [Apiospora marii]|uniref:Uncharacterized protein n=2 Tax=Apiospora marii TaxID=335849 RepID=A0ABR1RA88_9PEZI